ncbi:winged helix-turn-helix transcriptional regulator [Pantoea agglomerans]|jgi:DNA-binding HxlR family transcriptional regulator|uniref:winged helix-turn-helix transcriptional regulator n=2 Tax=Enterobacter agglomerans TaxID=549 RepID=UPI001D050C6B
MIQVLAPKTLGQIHMLKCNQPSCGVARFLILLDGPWATLIVRELLRGPQRFSELRTSLTGISAHTLTHRLRRFEKSGLVMRTAYAETPPKVIYELTELGKSLEPILLTMNNWGQNIPDDVLRSAIVNDNEM